MMQVTIIWKTQLQRALSEREARERAPLVGRQPVRATMRARSRDDLGPAGQDSKDDGARRADLAADGTGEDVAGIAHVLRGT